jgi:hypothetical protein
MRYEKNPWIDPRVEQLRMAQIENYLHSHGWARSKLREITRMRAFRDAELHGVFLPGIEDEEFLRYAIDAVECLARAEERYAGDVLTDLLSQSAADVAAKTTAPAAADKSEALTQPASR